MERQEPRFDKDMKDVEFRQRSYRGPSLPSASHRNEGFAWKIGVAVGVGVLAALLIFNAYAPHTISSRHHTQSPIDGVPKAIRLTLSPVDHIQSPIDGTPSPIAHTQSPIDHTQHPVAPR